MQWTDLSIRKEECADKPLFKEGDIAGRKLLSDDIVEVGTIRGFEHGKVLFESKGKTTLVHNNELIKIVNE